VFSYAAPFTRPLPLSLALNSVGNGVDQEWTKAEVAAYVKVFVNMWRALEEGVSSYPTDTSVHNVMLSVGAFKFEDELRGGG
jgi:hypothetical protein